MRVAKWTIALLCVTTVSLPGALYPKSISISGYQKNFFVVFRLPNSAFNAFLGLPEERTLGAVNKRLRIETAYEPGSWVSFRLAYDFSLRVQDQALFSNDLFFDVINPFDYRIVDIDRQLYPDDVNDSKSFGIFDNLDRAILTFRMPFSDLYVGRQVIAWGSARVINPTDIIAPFTFNELDKEERTGVDAVRWRIPVGLLGEIDTGYVPGKDLHFKNGAFWLRGKFHKLESDISLMLVGFRENLLLGLDVARAIGGAGFWLETAYVFAGALREANAANAEDYLRTSIGLDYSFSGKTYGFVEYHFNQPGSTEPENYLRNLSTTAYQDGAVYLLGKHYLAPGVTYQLTPLVTLAGQMLVNLTDQSFYLAPNAEYNIAENIYLAAGAFVGFGAAPGAFNLKSEFGSYPDTYYTSFRIYF